MREPLGVCNVDKEPHKQYVGLCKNWLSTGHGNPEEVNPVCQIESRLGIWVDGKFHPVDLGALGVLISDKDAEIEELRTTVKSENVRLTGENQTLKFSIDNEREISKAYARSIADVQRQLAEQENFAVFCVCKFKAGKVISLCGAHQTVVDETRDRIHEQYKMLYKELKKKKGFREA